MEIIKFDRIVSVNSELQGHSAKNILDGEISPNKNWMCEKGTEKAVVILQLERAVVLTSIHIGNAHSAFVEVLVGKAADTSDQFESLIPMSVFMNPQESKTGTNPNRTRFFNKSDFNEATASKSWDRIKVVCSQPFNKYVPYGLCFLKVNGEKEVKKSEILTKSEEKDEIEIGSFFKKRISSTAEDRTLTVSEQIKEAEKEESLMKHTPLTINKISEKLSSEKKQKPSEEQKSEEKTLKTKKDKSVEESKKDERKSDNKRKKDNGDEKPPKRRKEEKKKRKKKPFEKLMDDVVLVISGFENPLRGNLRSMALEMGAKYSSVWEPRCTHLVCAYENTPKFHQVKGRGKIVKKDWVEKCHKDKRRYPWRRFALDKTDLNKAESEEEIDAGEESEPEEEEEEEPIAGTSMSEEVEERCPEKAKSGSLDYDASTDDEEEKTEDTKDYPMPFLPDIFSGKIFYVDPNLKIKATLERYIVAYNGVITETFHENVDFYVTDKGGSPVKLFRKKAPNLVAIKPSWIWEINSKQKCIPTTPHLV